MKALLLAAGLGSRLRPLTHFRPKPLCLFYGQPILDLVYRQVLASKIENIAINTHHLGSKIAEHVENSKDVYAQKPLISFEPEILGTGGCVNPLRHWLGGDSLLIFNADIIADIDLPALIAQHRATKADATMVLLPQLKEGTTPVYWDGKSQIRAIGGSQEGEKATFSGVHIIGPRLIDAIPRDGFQHIIDSYQKLLATDGQIGAFLHQGFWADLGTPQDYFSAHQALLHAEDREKIARRLGLSSSINWLEKEGSACLDQTFEGQLSGSFLFGPVQLEQVTSIQDCIVYPMSSLSKRTGIKRLIITPDADLAF